MGMIWPFLVAAPSSTAAARISLAVRSPLPAIRAASRITSPRILGRTRASSRAWPSLTGTKQVSPIGDTPPCSSATAVACSMSL